MMMKTPWSKTRIVRLRVSTARWASSAVTNSAWKSAKSQRWRLIMIRAYMASSMGIPFAEAFLGIV